MAIGLGAALLLPFIPSRLAGLALAGFSGDLPAIYVRTPGMTHNDDIRPTQEGTPVAKMCGCSGSPSLIMDSRRKR